ncbi:MAG: BamA/TamA family outer membrane protein [Bacteroidetes bacterium]|nr:BamA/TamA family outer membrane protein [Bacteroidota bacterium]MCY4205936.1 BamA/TamA family outer membrane protein [Bacteroidota bacterium]
MDLGVALLKYYRLMFHKSTVWGVCVILGLAVLPTSAQYNNYFGRNKIQYEDFDWSVLETEHFDVYFYPEMQVLAEHGAAFAEEAYAELQNRFNFSVTRRVPIVFYSSQLHFKQTNITDGFIPDGVGGFYEFLKGRVVIPANGNLHRFRRVIRHEMVHVFTMHKLARVFRDYRISMDRLPPLWFVEGLAEYWSGPQDYQHEMIIRDAIFANYLVPLENIYRIGGTFVMYKQGEALCRFISEFYGEEKLLLLIENAWMNRDFRKVIEYTLQEDLNEISAEWQQWLRRTYYPELNTAESPTLLAEGLSVKGFNSKPVYYQKQDGQRWVLFTANHGGYSNVYYVPVDSTYAPLETPKILVPGERNSQFESFHLPDSRMSVSQSGRLAFVTKSGDADVIHIHDLESNETGPMYSFDGITALYSPSWSPDGKQLAFVAIDQSGFIDLYAYQIEQDHLRQLTNDSYDERDPAWSPDGNFLVFSSDRTSKGFENAYNLFTYELETGKIDYVTYGVQHDFSPNWSPDGSKIIYTSTKKDSTGRYDGQDLYVIDAKPKLPLVSLASNGTSYRTLPTRGIRWKKRLTDLTTSVYDPVWTQDEQVIFSSFENYRFTIRTLGGLDTLISRPVSTEPQAPALEAELPWTFPRIQATSAMDELRYRKRYGLDIAQGQISSSAVWGTGGAAVLAFSDLLGNDRFFITLYSTSQYTGDFLRSLNVNISRLHLNRRANIGYGVYRYGGLRYDLTDPDAPTDFPRYWEEVWGGYGAVSYPISMFRRVEVATSLSWDHKEIPLRRIDREALLLTNQVSLVHDNTLYGSNGPMVGWRGRLSAAYTTDILYSNVNYITIEADFRHYLRLARNVSFASRALGRMNHGREARLWFMGGSWDLRGYPFFDVRGNKAWFTSHELRFPLVEHPSVYIPPLAILGIVNLRSALFFDAAHTWNEHYHERIPQIYAGETLGSAGLGFRLNLFGGLVLRYDLGYRFRDGFQRREPNLFRQFFFGFDF